MAKTQINLEGWQDYRGETAGALLYIETSHQSIVPVRDQLNENGKGFFFEPNYETSTFGLISCCQAKSLNNILKNKSRYILFGTRYEGSIPDFKNKFLIMGYQRVDKVKDVRSRHLQHFLSNPSAQEPECLALEKSMATWGPMRFVALQDSFILTDDQLKTWGYKGRATRQLKVVFNKEHLELILAHLDSKPDLTDEYIATVDEYKVALEEEAE